MHGIQEEEEEPFETIPTSSSSNVVLGTKSSDNDTLEIPDTPLPEPRRCFASSVEEWKLRFWEITACANTLLPVVLLTYNVLVIGMHMAALLAGDDQYRLRTAASLCVNFAALLYLFRFNWIYMKGLSIIFASTWT